MTLLLLTLATTTLALFTAATAAATPPQDTTLSLLSWNLAAINNNPFEYHVGNTTKEHDQLMFRVAKIIRTPPPHINLPLSDLISPAMLHQLFTHMLRSPHYNDQHVKVVEDMWKKDYSHRKAISSFLKDVELGKKRLTSYPDRMTNTIRVEGVRGAGRHTGHHEGTTHPRPTVINCYNGTKDHFETLPIWWNEWMRFMFEDIVDLGTEFNSALHPHQLLRPIHRKKYPAISVDEELVSLPLQTLTLALFDAVLVNMMLSISIESDSDSTNNHNLSWHAIRQSTCAHMVWNKSARTRQILEETYFDVDVLFLQEASADFLYSMQASTIFKLLQPQYSTPQQQQQQQLPLFDNIRNQNSVVFVRRGSDIDRSTLLFESTDLDLDSDYSTAVKDVSREIEEYVSGLSQGDLYAVLIDTSTTTTVAELEESDTDSTTTTTTIHKIHNNNNEHSSSGSSSTASTPLLARLFVSFHGDTNGLLSVPLLKGVQLWIDSYLLDPQTPARDRSQLDVHIGMDANTYGFTQSTSKQNQQGFLRVVVDDLKMTTYLGNIISTPNQHRTTYNGRTFLQPQLNKAMTKEDVVHYGDRHLKDYVLFDGDRWIVIDVLRDNTGRKAYVEDMVYPTKDWPSDHAAITCVLKRRREGSGGEKGSDEL